MKIMCRNLNDLLNCIAGLVERGIKFEADTDSLTIFLTEGY